MEKTSTNGETELAAFISEIRERFKHAGKPKQGFFRTLLSKLFG